VICCLVGACSFPARTATVHSPAHAQLAALDRLAIVTSKGVMLWSSATGLRRVGPPLPTAQETTVSQLAWSPNGRYLAWLEGSVLTGNEQFVRLDTRTGTSATWQSGMDVGPLSFSGNNLVTIYGSFLHLFQLGGAISSIALSVNSGLSASYDDGFISLSILTNMDDPVQVWRDQVGGTTRQVGTLQPTGSLSEYAQISASPDGRWIALERGDHTDVCGNGPSSRLIILNTTNRAVVSPQLPVPARTVWRFGTIMYSGDSIIDFSAYEVKYCDADIRFPTRLFEVEHNRIRAVADNVIAGQRGPQGQLAVITGQQAFTVLDHAIPAMKVDGDQELEVNGKKIPTLAKPTAISWAPQNPAQ
jgi:hypothetical protein